MLFIAKPYNRGILGKLELCGEGIDGEYVSTHKPRRDGG